MLQWKTKNLGKCRKSVERDQKPVSGKSEKVYIVACQAHPALVKRV